MATYRVLNPQGEVVATMAKVVRRGARNPGCRYRFVEPSRPGVRAFQIPAIVAREQQIVAAAALALAGVPLTGPGLPVD